jgi:membrane protein insertase Oxa1/YidC/SpoIIIJ
MIGSVFHAAIYDPLYNGLVFLVGLIPTHDVGTRHSRTHHIVRFILFPSPEAVQAQLAMKEIAPEVEELKQKHKDNKEEQSKAIFALYKERGIHPFAGFALVLTAVPHPYRSLLGFCARRAPRR